MRIEDYLRELRAALRVGPLRQRRILREVEDHLRESARAEGSEQRAVERFGSLDEVVSRFSNELRPRARSAVWVFASSAVLIGTTGALSWTLSRHIHPSSNRGHSSPATKCAGRDGCPTTLVIGVDDGHPLLPFFPGHVQKKPLQKDVVVVDFGGRPVSAPLVKKVSSNSGQVTVALVPSRRWRCRPRPCWELRVRGVTGTVAFTTK